MDKKEVERLLKKKRPTGDELGRLYVANESLRLKTLGRDRLYDEARYLDSVKLLTKQDDKDLLEFYVYAADCLEQLLQEQMKFDAGFNDGLNQLMVRLHVIRNAETAEMTTNRTPLIMTDDEYEILYLKAKAHRMQRPATLEDATLAVIGSAFNQSFLQKVNPSQVLPDSVIKEIEALMTTVEEDKDIIKAYEVGVFNGLHQIIETGALVSRTELVDWLRDWRLKQRGSETYHHLARLFYRGIEDCKEAFKDNDYLSYATHTGPDKFFEIFEAYLSFKDISLVSNMIEKALDDILSDGVPLSKFIKVPVDTVSKYDILSIIFGHEQHPPETMTAYFWETGRPANAMRARFPQLWGAVEDYVAEAHPSDDMTWGSLAHAGIAVYKHSIEPSPVDLADCLNPDYWGHRERIINHGIAVIKPETQTAGQVYKDGLTDPVFALYQGINHIDEEELAIVEKAHDYVTKGARRIFDMDEAFDVLAEMFGVDFEWAKRGDSVKAGLWCLNSAVYMSYLGIQGDDETKAAKRAKFKSVFRDFDVEDYLPPEKTIEKGRKRLFSLKAERDKDYIVDEINRYINNLYKNRK